MYSDELERFIRACLNVNSKDRPSASEFLKSKLIKNKSAYIMLDTINDENLNDQNTDTNCKLLRTILPPINRNFSSLCNKFPKSNYKNDLSQN